MSPERRSDYGLTNNPISNVTPKQLKLSKKKRTVRPTTYELRAYCKVADATPYPYGPFHKAILLTGAVRKTELAEAEWSEFDFEMKLWTVPKKRVKNGEEHSEHLVPLTDEMISLLNDIKASQPPGHGNYVFSTTYGQKPINGFGKATAAFRVRMQAVLLELRPELEFRKLILHDTRRLVRSALSALDVPEVVAETVIGHGRKGIQGVYDQYKYLPQVRRALSLFTCRLYEILNGDAHDFPDDNFLAISTPTSWRVVE